MGERFEIRDLQLAFQHTEGEIGALWQRNQAFLVANSLLALLVGDRVEKFPWFAFAICILRYNLLAMVPS